MKEKSLLDACEFIVYWMAKFALLPTLIVISFVGLFIGAFLILKPQLAIEIQKRFYALINWKIEPISMSCELRNTKIMGWLLILLCWATLFFTSNRNPIFP
jgi:hypothetical protein